MHMSKRRALARNLLICSVLVAPILLFQNCGRFESASLSSSVTSFSVSDPAPCVFNGHVLLEGESRDAFQTSAVPAGQTCVKQTRTCHLGVLSGSYDYAACGVGQPASCLFNGTTVASGSAVTAYLNSTASSVASCASQTRTCTNGVLSGNYAFGACAPAARASCLFNGRTLQDGDSVNAFAQASVGFGQTCAPEQRTCTNGNLSGSAPMASCEVGAPAGCLFNGQTVAHGASVTAWAAATSSSCQSESRACSNGNLSGSFANASCAKSGCTFDGKSFDEGQAFDAYRAPESTQCTPYRLRCVGGQVDGAEQIKYGSCTKRHETSCMVDKTVIPEGGTFPAWSTYFLAGCNTNMHPVIPGGPRGSSIQADNTCTDGRIIQKVWPSAVSGYIFTAPERVRTWCSFYFEARPTGLLALVNIPPDAVVYSDAHERFDGTNTICSWSKYTCHGVENFCSQQPGMDYESVGLERVGHCPTVTQFDWENPEPQALQ